MSVITVMILCMVVAGLLGGLVNLAMDQETKPNWFTDPSLADFPWRTYCREVAISTAAAFLTPLFLSMTDSQLVEKFVGTVPPVVQKEGEPKPSDPQPDPASGFLFFGFCLVAALTSKRFIQTVSDSILKRVNEAENKATVAASQAQKAAEIATETALENADPGVVADATGVSESAALSVPHVTLTASQRQLLQAFQNNLNRYEVRSVRGLAQDAQLSEAIVRQDLDALAQFAPPLVRRRESLGPAAWSLTRTGRIVDTSEGV